MLSTWLPAHCDCPHILDLGEFPGLRAAQSCPAAASQRCRRRHRRISRSHNCLRFTIIATWYARVAETRQPPVPAGHLEPEVITHLNHGRFKPWGKIVVARNLMSRPGNSTLIRADPVLLGPDPGLAARIRSGYTFFGREKSPS